MGTATLRIWRGDSSGGAFRDYATEVAEGMVVLDAVLKVQSEQANALSGIDDMFRGAGAGALERAQSASATHRQRAERRLQVRVAQPARRAIAAGRHHGPMAAMIRSRQTSAMRRRPSLSTDTGARK